MNTFNHFRNYINNIMNQSVLVLAVNTSSNITSSNLNNTVFDYISSYKGLYGLEALILLFGLVLINSLGNIRSILGIIFINSGITIYMIQVGYILIPILLFIGIIVISIIIYMLKYNNFNIYNNNRYNRYNFVLLTLMLYIIYVSWFNNNNDYISYNKINNIELISFSIMFESNIMIHFLILMIYIILLLIHIMSSHIKISYNLQSLNTSYFSIISYLYLNLFLYVIIAILLCLLPIIIRYNSKISKYNTDVYEVGIGVNLSNSIYNYISNNNLGSYLIFYYLYLFIMLDLFVTIIIISYLTISSISYLMIPILVLMLYSLNPFSSISTYDYSSTSHLFSYIPYYHIYYFTWLVSSSNTVLSRTLKGFCTDTSTVLKTSK